MNKEYTEAFNRISLHTEYDNDSPYDCLCFEADCKLVDDALERLEAIDNTNPSEALERLEEMYEKLDGLIYCDYENGYYQESEYKLVQSEITDNYDTIKQALLKVQEQEDKAKAFDLINTKNVDIKLLKWAYPSVEAYNVTVREQKDYWWREELTKEEFEFLGRMVGAK